MAGEVRVPKLNANDTTYTLVEWLAADGEWIDKDEPVAVVETSKAAEELATEQGGYLRTLLDTGTECEYGQVIARLFETAEEHAAAAAFPAPAQEAGPAGHGTGTDTSEHNGASILDGDSDGGSPNGSSAAGVVITAPARELMSERGITMEQVASLGRRIVRREDLQKLLGASTDGTSPKVNGSEAVPAGADSTGADSTGTDSGAGADSTGPTHAGPNHAGAGSASGSRSGSDQAGAGDLQRLPRAQQAVASVVTDSHRNIPAAFVAVKARVGASLDLGRRLTREHRCLIGLPELLIKAIAAQHEQFPLCFASPVDPATVRLAPAAQVGITVDVGKGLHIPVIRNVADLSWRELGQTVMGFRLTAMRGAFRPDELVGASLIVALHNDEDVTVAVPLVFPGQVCAVSLGAVQQELTLTDEGEVRAESVVQVGLAYDHRVINGSDAVAFLKAIAGLLGAPETLEPLGAR